MLRSIERALESKSNDSSARAQDLFYEAMDAPSDDKELALLEQALKLNPGNVDAWLALPRELPGAYAPGSKEEAMCFAEGLCAAWRKHPAALK